MSLTILFALGCGVLGVIYAIMTAMWVSKQDAGSAKMQEISNAVKEGAYAFLAREYKTVAMVAVVLVVLIAAMNLGIWTAIGFIVGTFGSALAGFVGMWVTVRANVRTTQAAHRGSPGCAQSCVQGRLGYRRYGCWSWNYRPCRLLYDCKGSKS